MLRKVGLNWWRISPQLKDGQSPDTSLECGVRRSRSFPLMAMKDMKEAEARRSFPWGSSGRWCKTCNQRGPSNSGMSILESLGYDMPTGNWSCDATRRFEINSQSPSWVQCLARILFGCSLNDKAEAGENKFALKPSVIFVFTLISWLTCVHSSVIPNLIGRSNRPFAWLLALFGALRVLRARFSYCTWPKMDFRLLVDLDFN